MRLGASTWSFFREADAPPRLGLSTAVHQILSLDLSLGAEVWGPDPRLDPSSIRGTQLFSLAEACQDLAYVTVHMRPQYWSWDPHQFRHEIAFGHQLGAETLVLHPVCLGLHTPEDRPDWPEIRRIAEEAAKFGLTLAVENTADSVSLLDRVLDELGDDPERSNVGICLDVGHAAMSVDAGRDGVPNYLDRYAGSLVHVHLHDNDGQHDDHRAPGDGRVDWRSVMDKLHTMNYQRTAILEVHTPGEDPQETIRRSVGFLEAQAKRS